MLRSWWDFMDEKESGHLWLIKGNEKQLLVEDAVKPIKR